MAIWPTRTTEIILSPTQKQPMLSSRFSPCMCRAAASAKSKTGCGTTKKALGHQRKELDKAEARLGEINLLFRKLYEDNALGRLSNEQFVFLTSGYEDEKRELIKRAAELKKEIDTADERSADVKRFVALVRLYTEIGELTYENVHEFIDRIGVYELDKNTSTRKIEIFYSFVG